MPTTLDNLMNFPDDVDLDNNTKRNIDVQETQKKEKRGRVKKRKKKKLIKKLIKKVIKKEANKKAKKAAKKAAEEAKKEDANKNKGDDKKSGGFTDFIKDVGKAIAKNFGKFFKGICFIGSVVAGVKKCFDSFKKGFSRGGKRVDG